MTRQTIWSEIEKEDKAIAAYLSTYQTHGLEAAMKVFFEQSK